MSASLQTSGSALYFPASKLKLERTFDAKLIRELIVANWNATRCDYLKQTRATWQPSMHDSMIYLAYRSAEGETIGLFSLVPRTTVSYAMHVNMTKKAYGETATRGMRMMFEWVWRNTKATRIVGEVPEYNTLALRLAQRSGMRICGFQPHSWMRDGKLYAVILFGISRKAVR